MRRLLALLIVPALVLTACGNNDDSSDDKGGGGSASLSAIKVSGDEGKEPKVSGVKGVSVDKIETDVVAEGDGDEVKDGETVDLNYVLYGAKDGKSLTGTYDAGQPVGLTLDKANDDLLAGSIIGHKIGTQMLIAAPVKEFYGKGGGEAQGLKDDDTLVLVTDVVSKFEAPKANGTIADVTVTGKYGKEPKVESKNPLFVAKTQSKDVVAGKGKVVKKGEAVTVRYIGVDARTGKTFDSSYKKGSTADFTLDAGSVIPGFVKGLAGHKLGSRVLVTMPYTDGYGEAGNAQAGIEGGDSLIFVVDLVKKGAKKK